MAILMMVVIIVHVVIFILMTYLQACKEHWGGSFNEVCLTCLQSKANIGR